ncbi:MAG: ADP-forming succinate--CoA ligase subunit beta [Candidatus Omnitrophica bacterium]|nr:ADP-forming succinate--CoA ligase subunit beta [Candidatus Omnitrophota bacterium]
MKVHEYQARDILQKAGIPVPEGGVAVTVDEALAFAVKIGFPVVLKAQVLVGGRGKAGGVKVVKTEDGLKETFEQIKALTIKGYPVEKIFVVKAIDIQKEVYMAITIDNAKDDVVLIASSAGGVDIEETAKTNPEKIQKFYLEGQRDIDEHRWVDFISNVFDGAQAQAQGTKIFQKLLDVFFQKDCTLAEINPLVVNEQGQWLAADAKMNFDDNALFRQDEVAALRDMAYEDPDEVEAKECDLSFVKLDGNVGCIVNGAGLAMGTMDIIKLLGGEPANFLDVGGSSNPEKVLNALKIILKNEKVKAVLINIFGGITRCDDIANGILEARKQLDLNVPLVVRLTGTNEEEAKELLAQNGISIFSTMREAVLKVVETVSD